MQIQKNRRGFMGKLGIGLIGISLFSFSPMRIFSGKKELKSETRIRIHPDAVKRNKKGSAK